MSNEMAFPPPSVHALLEQYNINLVEDHLDGASMDDLHSAYYDTKDGFAFQRLAHQKWPAITFDEMIGPVAQLYIVLGEWGNQPCFETEYRGGRNIITWQNPAHLAMFGFKEGTRARLLGKMEVVDMAEFLQKTHDTPQTFVFTQVQTVKGNVEVSVETKITVMGTRGFARMLSPAVPDKEALQAIVSSSSSDGSGDKKSPMASPRLSAMSATSDGGGLHSLASDAMKVSTEGEGAPVDPYKDVKDAMDASGQRQMLADMSFDTNHRLVHMTPVALVGASSRSGKNMTTHLQVQEYFRTNNPDRILALQQATTEFHTSGGAHSEQDTPTQKWILDRHPNYSDLVIITLEYHPRAPEHEAALLSTLTLDTSQDFRGIFFLDGATTLGKFIGFNPHSIAFHAKFIKDGESYDDWIENSPAKKDWERILTKARCGVEAYTTMGMNNVPFHVRRLPGPHGYYEVTSGMPPLQKYSIIASNMTVPVRLVDLAKGNPVLGTTVYWNDLCHNIMCAALGNASIVYKDFDDVLFKSNTPMGAAREDLFAAFDAVRLAPMRSSLVRLVACMTGGHLKATMRRVSMQYCLVSLVHLDNVKFMSIFGEEPSCYFQCRQKDAVWATTKRTYKSGKYPTHLAAAIARHAFIQGEGWATKRPKMDPVFLVSPDDGYSSSSSHGSSNSSSMAGGGGK